MPIVNLHSGVPSSGLSEANEASSDWAERPRLELRLSSEPSSSFWSAERMWCWRDKVSVSWWFNQGKTNRLNGKQPYAHTDRQGMLVSSDLHGTGNSWGFLLNQQKYVKKIEPKSFQSKQFLKWTQCFLHQTPQNHRLTLPRRAFLPM